MDFYDSGSEFEVDPDAAFGAGHQKIQQVEF